MITPDHKPDKEAGKEEEDKPGLVFGAAAAAVAAAAPAATEAAAAAAVEAATAAKAEAAKAAAAAATNNTHHPLDSPGGGSFTQRIAHTATEVGGGKKSGDSASQPTVTVTQMIIAMIIGVVLAALASPYLPFSADPEKAALARAEVLQQQLQQVEQSFGNQRDELWRRIHIHLQRHVKSTNPSEPVSLVLVGGRRAESTVGCLAVRLAEAFSKAYDGLVLQLDGTQLASAGSDKAKRKLDDELKKAFEGDKPAAVIHRLEELPPSSSLIFYSYCDHESAAYKHPLMAFTVLLPLDTVGPEVSLPKVEEMVHGHIHQKFLIPDQPDTFDKMDVDKLSGLWNRIAHLILPVTAEEHIEKGGCERN